MSDSRRQLKRILDGAGEKRSQLIAQIKVDTGLSHGAVARFIDGAECNTSTVKALERWVQDYSKYSDGPTAA